MNVTALAGPFTGLFTCANLCAAATSRCPRFVLNTSTNGQSLFTGDLRLLLVVLAHGSGFPPDFRGLPSVVGSRLPQHIRLRRRCRALPHLFCRSTSQTHGPGAASGVLCRHTGCADTNV